MRDELEHAQARIQEMQHAVRKAERNLDVSRVDHAEMNKSIAFHVGKIDSLVGVTRDMRGKRASMLAELAGTRRRYEYRAEVLQNQALQSEQEKQESNRTKRAALQQTAHFKAKVSKLRAKATRPLSEYVEAAEEESIAETWAIRYKQKNRGVTAQFEQHVRCALATGATARQVTDMLLLCAIYLLEPSKATIFRDSMPQLRWFQTQREGLGVESYIYSFMRIAGAARVLQWGFDETTLDGVSVLNQWAMLEFEVAEGGGGGGVQGVTIVTLECAGVLPCGLAVNVVEHIELSWARGQAAVEALRAELGPDLADQLCPIVAGGVNLHKLFGVMHDTCHAANLVASLMVDLQQRKKREFLSDEVWELVTPQSKAIFNFLCGNHTRNLPIDRFNKLYDKWLEEILGPAMREAKTGAAVRLECNGIQFLRTVCRLTHTGSQQYAKGDGDAFKDYLEANYPNVTSAKVNRAETSKRQDWSVEASYDIYPLLEPLMAYTVGTLLQEANLLRDSLLVTLESLHFEAYVHVNAIMWRVVFKELRGLTNSKGLEINPTELNALYEYLYDLGVMLQTAKCMSVFDIGFRPWPHIYKPELRSKKFYTRVDYDLTSDLARLRTYNDREDSDKYREILIAVLGLFGKGIIESLEFTMGDYLKQTNGKLSNDKRETWELEAVKGMVSHNNHAERPFAVLRAIWKTYPSLSLKNLGWLSHSLANGTHRPASTYGVSKDTDGNHCSKPGIALTAHPELRRAVSVVCSVRRKRIGCVTELVRAAQISDTTAQITTRKRRAREKHLHRLRLKASQAAKTDKAEHTAAHHLVLSTHDLHDQLSGRSNNKQSQITFLKDQFDARVVGDLKRTYSSIGSRYRKRGGGLRKCPAEKKDELAYLTELLCLMIKEDQDTLGLNAITVATSSFEYIRFLPSISAQFSNPKGTTLKPCPYVIIKSNNPTHYHNFRTLPIVAVQKLKDKFEAEVAELAAPVDDPVYVDLAGKYMGAILYDNETRATWKLYRVTSIQFIRSYSSQRPSCWEATCEPVYRDAKTGHFIVPDDQRVADSKVLKTTALQGYALAEYREGLDQPPTQLPWVQQYIDHFRSVVMPRYPSLFAPEDCPSFTGTDKEAHTSRRRKRPAQSSTSSSRSRKN